MKINNMKPSTNKSVLMVEFSEFRYDARVSKEANSIKKYGFEVTLIMYSEFVQRKTITREEGLTVTLYAFPNIRDNRGIVHKLLRIVRTLPIIMQMWIQIFRSRAQVYHAHNLYFLIPTFIKARLTGGLLVYDAHELHSQHHSNKTIWGRLRNKRNYVFEGFFIRRADAVIEASDERASYVSGLYQIPKPVVVNNHTCIQTSTGDYCMRREAGLSGSAKIVLYTGGVYVGPRRFDKVVEALSFIEAPEVCFVIIGFMNQTAKDHIMSVADKFHVTERVVLLPPVDSSQVVTAAASASVGVIPLTGHTLNNRLSALNKISEYLMAGLPIACTDYSNLRDIVYSNSIGQVGETFDVNDAHSIKNAVLCVLENHESLSVNARKLALRELNWEKEERRLLQLYRDLWQR